MAHKVAGIQNVLNSDVDGCKRIWRWLTMEADQAWKDTNNILFSHQLKYDAELAEFITEIERILQGKCMEIWDHITCIAAHLSPEAGLCLALHMVESLPTIPMDLCFCSDSNAAGILPRVLPPSDMGPHGGWGLFPGC